MKNITVSISDQEYGILESWLGAGQIEVWLQHAINNKCRQRIDASITEYTAYNPNKMTMEEKLTTLSGIELPQREEY